MTEHKDIRKSVSKAYAKFVSGPDKGPCCAKPAENGPVAALAGYDRHTLLSLPSDAVSNSFGCGNPLAFSEVKEGDVVLDLGSGAGIDILIAGKVVGPKGRAIGIDMTDEMIAKAHENIAASGLDNVEVRKGIIEELPVESSSVDWVISNCVINLSPEKDRVFAEIARVLKPGGQMLVSDIVAKDLPDWARQDKMLYNTCVAGAINEEDYVQGLESAGLERVEVRERFVYDESQLVAFAQTDSDESAGCGCGCAPAESGDAAKTIAKNMVGNVWSAQVYGQKPVA